MSSSKKLRVACVGTGYFSQFHYEAWQRLENVELVAVCNRSLGKAQEFAKRYGTEAVYDDLPALLSEMKPDLVDVITPPETHLTAVSQCLEFGCDVICQKPFGEDLEQARTMTNLAKTTGKKLIIHENFRFMPWYRKIKQMLDEKIIGEVVNITYRLRPGDGQGEEAYLARQPYFQKMPRFLVHETGIHFIDTFRYLIGEIDDVSARLRKCNPVISGEDAGIVIFGFANKVQGIFDGNRCLDHATTNPRRTMGEMLVEGETGSIRLDGEANIWLRSFAKAHEKVVSYSWSDNGFGGDCVFELIQHVAAHFCSGANLENTAEEYLVNIEIEQAIYQSHGDRQVKDIRTSKQTKDGD